MKAGRDRSSVYSLRRTVLRSSAVLSSLRSFAVPPVRRSASTALRLYVPQIASPAGAARRCLRDLNRRRDSIVGFDATTCVARSTSLSLVGRPRLRCSVYAERFSCGQRPHNRLGQYRITAEVSLDGVPSETVTSGVDRFPERDGKMRRTRRFVNPENLPKRAD